MSAICAGERAIRRSQSPYLESEPTSPLRPVGVAWPPTHHTRRCRSSVRPGQHELRPVRSRSSTSGFIGIDSRYVVAKIGLESIRWRTARRASATNRSDLWARWWSATANQERCITEFTSLDDRLIQRAMLGAHGVACADAGVESVRVSTAWASTTDSSSISYRRHGVVWS